MKADFQPGDVVFLTCDLCKKTPMTVIKVISSSTPERIPDEVGIALSGEPIIDLSMHYHATGEIIHEKCVLCTWIDAQGQKQQHKFNPQLLTQNT